MIGEGVGRIFTNNSIDNDSSLKSILDKTNYIRIDSRKSNIVADEVHVFIQYPSLRIGETVCLAETVSFIADPFDKIIISEKKLKKGNISPISGAVIGNLGGICT